MIKKDPAKAYEIMGADVKQTGEQFGNSAKYLRWQDRAANQKFFTGDFLAFNKEAADLLLEIGIIKDGSERSTDHLRHQLHQVEPARAHAGPTSRPVHGPAHRRIRRSR